jgi:hypothetical protein
MYIKEEKMSKELIRDIINWFEGDTIKFVDRVMSDDKTNPEYSAVTCGNRIITLIMVKEGYSNKYKAIKDYLLDSGYGKEDINIFMESREKEKQYYYGEIYSLKNGEILIEQNEH